MLSFCFPVPINVDRELRKSGILNLIGESRYFAHFEQALEHVIELDQQAH